MKLLFRTFSNPSRFLFETGVGEDVFLEEEQIPEEIASEYVDKNITGIDKGGIDQIELKKDLENQIAAAIKSAIFVDKFVDDACKKAGRTYPIQEKSSIPTEIKNVIFEFETKNQVKVVLTKDPLYKEVESVFEDFLKTNDVDSESLTFNWLSIFMVDIAKYIKKQGDEESEFAQQIVLQAIIQKKILDSSEGLKKEYEENLDSFVASHIIDRETFINGVIEGLVTFTEKYDMEVVFKNEEELFIHPSE